MDELRSRIAALLARLDASRLGSLLQKGQRIRRRGSRGLAAMARPLGAPLRRARALIRPGRPPVSYRDKMITLDRDGLIINSYYLPFGRRRIPYERIRKVETYPLTGARMYRIHGFGWPRLWYHRDRQRAQRGVGLVLQTNKLLRPVLTPEEPDRVQDLLEERISQRAPDPGQVPS